MESRGPPANCGFFGLVEVRMDYLFGALGLLALIAVFWFLGRVLSRTSRNQGDQHGNPSGGPQG